MKIKLYLTVLSIIVGIKVNAQLSKKVLFIGNSYTYYNNMPQITADLALSTGDTLLFDSNSPGGFTFQGHSTNSVSLNKIIQGNWDFVVLQEQSQLPSFPISQVQSDVYPFARKLDSLINKYNTCAETIFYMTWGRKNGDASNCVSYPPVCSYSGMDSLLAARYKIMADTNNALLSPVGAVWKYIRQNFPMIELYQADESHPSPAGSYLAACCFYTTVFRKNPMLINYDFTLPAADAANIRAAVKSIVFDNLSDWNIGDYDPVANYTYSSTGNNFTFSNLSVNATNYSWDFGDGNTSNSVNPSHNYLQNGNYIVKLITSECNLSDTISQTINIITASLVANKDITEVIFYPNPVSNELILNIETIDQISIYNSLGEIFFPTWTVVGGKTRINFSNFCSGIYFLSIQSDDELMKFKIVKE